MVYSTEQKSVYDRIAIKNFNKSKIRQALESILKTDLKKLSLHHIWRPLSTNSENIHFAHS
jgi:hypothetical protein